MSESESLWRQTDFLKFWTGQTVSLFGSRVTFLALPLTAIVTLHATSIQVGILSALRAAAALVFGLPAGVWVDRLQRRTIMVATNLAQAVMLFSVPVASWMGVLDLPQLYAVTFLTATCALFFNAAYRSYLPALVPGELLVEANSKLAMSSSAAQIAGPGLGGLLVQLLTAPIAILADAISFVVGSLSVMSLRVTEVRVASVRRGMRHEIAEGMMLLLKHPILRSIAGASSCFNLFEGVLSAVYILYMSHDLHLSATTIGVVLGLGGAGGLLGVLLVAPLSARLGIGRTLISGVALATAGQLLIAAAGGSTAVVVSILLVAEAMVELGVALYAINAASLHQTVPPEGLRGRVIATHSLISVGLVPLGALLGGVLGEVIGLRQTIIVAGAGTLLSLPWVTHSSVRLLRELPVTPVPV